MMSSQVGTATLSGLAKFDNFTARSCEYIVAHTIAISSGQMPAICMDKASNADSIFPSGTKAKNT